MKVGGGVYSNKLGVVVVMTRETKEQLGASPTEAVEIVTGGWYLQRQGRWAANESVAQAPNLKQIMQD